MPQSLTIAGRSPEALRPANVGASAAKQFERARRLVNMTRTVGPVNAARAAYGRITGGDTKDPITLKSAELRFPITMTASPYDIYGFTEVLGENVYRLPSIFGQRINGKPIVDMGAYIGISAAYFASRYPDSSVLAVEPHPRNYRLLSSNSAAYGGQIDARQAAFVAAPGGVGRTILESPESHMTNLYSSGGGEKSSTNGARCAAMTPELLLTALGGEEIGLLKVDIEGGERDVFEAPGMADVLDATSLLMVETHDNFVPGSSAAVEAATAASGMEPLELNPHTSVYFRA